MKPAVLCAALLAAFPALAQELPGWHLLWNDEFDGAAVDETKWRIEHAALVKNDEKQYYAPDDVYLEDGCLVLRSQRRAMGGREFTSGLVDSRGKFAMLYGRIEIRAKLPKGQGLWPAHWMLPDDGSWPPEIDIMELVGSQPDNVVMSLHSGQWPDLESQTMDHLGPDFSAGFHTFALEWEPDELRWYVDGNQQFSTGADVPQKAMYIILNTAVGGHMPGDPDDTTVFPQMHRIDYVRVYGREVPGTFFLVTAADRGRIAVSPKEPRYRAGAPVTLRAVSSIGYRFDRWSGDLEGAENPARVTMDAHRRIRAHFAPDPEAPALLSRGKPVTATSVEDDRFPARFATDGDPGTRWSSAFADPQSVTVDLGERHAIRAIRLEWENAYAKSYLIDVSDDGRTWRNIHSKKGGHGRTEEIIGLTASGRYVRVTGTARGTEWGYSLWELEVFGK